MMVQPESLAPITGRTPEPPDVRAHARLHASLAALPGLLAEAEIAEAHAEARDRRSGALVAHSFVTIHRALARHVAEVVRAAPARLEIEVSPGGRGDEARASGPEDSPAPSTPMDPVAPMGRHDSPGQYL
jgi:hypothetical protein